MADVIQLLYKSETKTNCINRRQQNTEWNKETRACNEKQYQLYLGQNYNTMYILIWGAL